MSEYILTGKQSKAADRIAIFEMGIPSLKLMQNASECVAQHIMAKYGTETAVLSAAGVGNNGADGLCICAILAKAGYRCGVLICGNMEKATDEFLFQLEAAGNAGVRLMEYEKSEDAAYMKEWLLESKMTDGKAAEGVILLDALFGIGLHRTVEGRYAEFINTLNYMMSEFCYVCAVDIPSGIDADNGRVQGCAVKACDTVTFGCNKIGLLVSEGASFAGNVYVNDIGIPDEAYEKALAGFDKTLTEE